MGNSLLKWYLQLVLGSLWWKFVLGSSLRTTEFQLFVGDSVVWYMARKFNLICFYFLCSLNTGLVCAYQMNGPDLADVSWVLNAAGNTPALIRYWLVIILLHREKMGVLLSARLYLRVAVSDKTKVMWYKIHLFSSFPLPLLGAKKKGFLTLPFVIHFFPYYLRDGFGELLSLVKIYYLRDGLWQLLSLVNILSKRWVLAAAFISKWHVFLCMSRYCYIPIPFWYLSRKIPNWLLIPPVVVLHRLSRCSLPSTD